MKKVLVIYGGKSSEHDISIVSKNYLIENLKETSGIEFSETLFPQTGELPQISWRDFDYIIPCFHGHPGETGTIQSLLDLYGLPYLGCSSEAHQTCFHKVTTKLYFESLNIPNTPFIYGHKNDLSFPKRALFFLKGNPRGVFLKASRQGSSVGCIPITQEEELEPALKDCFQFDSYILIEKKLTARELEVSAFEYQGQLHITKPGEILPPENSFYSFEEKYSETSQSRTLLEACLTENQIQQIQQYAKKAFENLELKDLARIDFFLTKGGNLYLNEINTFPGLTPISMFPKMMENYGVRFSDFLEDRIIS